MVFRLNALFSGSIGLDKKSCGVEFIKKRYIKLLKLVHVYHAHKRVGGEGPNVKTLRSPCPVKFNYMK